MQLENTAFYIGLKRVLYRAIGREMTGLLRVYSPHSLVRAYLEKDRYARYYREAQREYAGTKLEDSGLAVSGFAVVRRGFPVDASLSARIAEVFADASLTISLKGDSWTPGIDRTAVYTYLNKAGLRALALDGLLHHWDLPNRLEAHLGSHVRINHLDVYKTYPRTHSPVGSFLWHFDNQPHNSFKIFAYLSKVDAGAGPLCYQPGTHRKYHGLPRYGWSRSRDQSPIACQKFLGEAGDTVIFNVNGLHTGGHSEERERIVLCASLTPSKTPWRDNLHRLGYSCVPEIEYASNPEEVWWPPPGCATPSDRANPGAVRSMPKEPHMTESVNPLTFFGVDPARIKRGLRKANLSALLEQAYRVDTVRRIVGVSRYLYFVVLRNRLRTLDSESKNIGINTISHNLKGIKDFSVHRSHKLVRPLSVIETLNRDSKVLSIGPRTEGELFNLVGAGFAPANVRGLDLISYSPWIDLGDMHQLPYANDTWDAVVLGWSLAYSDNRHRAAYEVVRVTRPGGIVAVGLEYNPQGAEELSRAVGYQVCDEVRIEHVSDLLALFEGHVDHVYFSHEPRPQDRGRVGSVIAVFSIKK